MVRLGQEAGVGAEAVDEAAESAVKIQGHSGQRRLHTTMLYSSTAAQLALLYAIQPSTGVV